MVIAGIMHNIQGPVRLQVSLHIVTVGLLMTLSWLQFSHNNYLAKVRRTSFNIQFHDVTHIL